MAACQFSSRSSIVQPSAFARHLRELCPVASIGRSNIFPIRIRIKLYQRFPQNFLAFLKNTEGNDWNDTAAVFTGTHGGFMSGDYLNNCFRNMMKDAGMPGMHLHDLRHANASILINEGVPMKVVSEHLGHSSVNVTEKFYTHMFAESQKITAEVIENVLK